MAGGQSGPERVRTSDAEQAQFALDQPGQAHLTVRHARAHNRRRITSSPACSSISARTAAIVFSSSAILRMMAVEGSPDCRAASSIKAVLRSLETVEQRREVTGSVVHPAMLGQTVLIRSKQVQPVMSCRSARTRAGRHRQLGAGLGGEGRDG